MQSVAAPTLQLYQTFRQQRRDWPCICSKLRHRQASNQGAPVQRAAVTHRGKNFDEKLGGYVEREFRRLSPTEHPEARRSRFYPTAPVCCGRQRARPFRRQAMIGLARSLIEPGAMAGCRRSATSDTDLTATSLQGTLAS